MKAVRDCLEEIYERFPKALLFDGEEEYDKATVFGKLSNCMNEEASVEWWTEEFMEEYGVAGNVVINGQVEFNIFPMLELHRIDFQ